MIEVPETNESKEASEELISEGIHFLQAIQDEATEAISLEDEN